jgi:arginyl-tRNA synthetase
MILSQILTSIEKSSPSLIWYCYWQSGISNHTEGIWGRYNDGDFPLLKVVKSNPVELGNKIGNYLVENVAEVSRFNVVSGFEYRYFWWILFEFI